MEESSSFSSPAQLIQGFNEIQNNLGDSFNMQQGVSKAREIAGNMLLTIGTPFFAERLKKHIGEDAVNAIQKYAKGEMNLGDVLDVAKSKFETDILPQAKQALFSEASKYVPGLENINLENATVNDIRNAFQSQITNKLKSALPEDIANNLPTSFSQADILNSVRQMGTDQALAYAKKTLPPDVYSQLESNQDLIRDPTKIASFINSSIANAKTNISQLATTTQQNIASKLNETKQALVSKAEETLAPLRDKVSSLNTLRQQGVSKFEEQKQNIISKFEDINSKMEDFKQANPMHIADDLAPFENQIKDLKVSGRALRADFLNSDKDLASQLDGAKSMLQSNTDLLYSKLNNLKSGIFTKANEVFDQTRATGTQAVAQTRQALTTTRESLQAAERDTRAAMPEFRSPFPDEEPVGMLDRFKAWGQGKIKKFTEPVTRRAEDIVTQNEGYKPRMMQADEPENAFSETALTFKNPALTDYYGTELMNPADLLRDNSKPVITRGRKVKAPKQKAAEEQSAEAQPEIPRITQQDQLAPMREMMERRQQQQAAAEEPSTKPSATAEPQEPAAPIQPEAPQAPVSEQAPTPTQVQTTQSLSEPLEEETANTAMTDITQTAEKTTTSVASKIGDVSKGLEEAAAGAEEVPVLDILMDVGGLIGSILGGTKLLGGNAPALPAISGSSYEPNL
jgi:hypothetical protein